MTRGRKKDSTITPTRALALQRDYRARKAQYVFALESQWHATEEENMRLRKELELAREGILPIFSAESVRISPSAYYLAGLSIHYTGSCCIAAKAKLERCFCFAAAFPTARVP
jgi:hypothetical protein